MSKFITWQIMNKSFICLWKDFLCDNNSKSTVDCCTVQSF
jgi:hypothetical protein